MWVGRSERLSATTCQPRASWGSAVVCGCKGLGLLAATTPAPCMMEEQSEHDSECALRMQLQANDAYL
jgi:hypothetical protein